MLLCCSSHASVWHFHSSSFIIVISTVSMLWKPWVRLFSYLWALRCVSCFNQPPIPLRTDTPQSPQLPHQSPSPPDYSPTEVGPGDHAGPVKASTSLEPPLCPLLYHCVLWIVLPTSHLCLFALCITLFMFPTPFRGDFSKSLLCFMSKWCSLVLSLCGITIFFAPPVLFTVPPTFSSSP